MTITADQIASAVSAEARHELGEALQRIRHCLRQLNDEQVWWRPADSQNSIGDLLLHLCGNLQQWAVAGFGVAEDRRNRPQEFAQRGPIPKAALLSQLEEAVAAAGQSLGAVTAAELFRVRRIQGFDVTGLGAIFSTVPHFRGHTQEIICRTRLLLGDKYKFEWQPPTPEQGAPA